MTSTTSSASVGVGPRSQPQIPRSVKIVFGLFALLMAFYGYLVADMGYLIGVKGSDPQDNARIVQMVEQGMQDPASLEKNRLFESSGAWMWLESQFASTKYEYGKDSIFETISVYLKTETSARLSLATHMGLGLIIMCLGPLQFWAPARKRYPKMHRYLGYFYVGTVLLSMALAANYLMKTEPYHGILGPHFYRGLIGANVITTVTILLAVFFVLKKNMYRHQAFMAFNFMLLLTAPMLRVVWGSVSSLFHEHLTFQLMNTFAQQMVLPLCLLTAYLMYTMARAYQRPLPELAPNPSWTAKAGRIASYLLFPVGLMWAYAMLLSFDHFLGLGWGLTSQMIYSEGLQHLEHVVLQTQPMLAWGSQLALASSFVIAFGLLLELFNPSLLQKVTRISFVRVGAYAFLPLSMLIFSYGVAIGLPSSDAQGGGGVFITLGIYGSLFGAWLLAMHLLGKDLIAKELALICAAMLTGYAVTMLGWHSVYPGQYHLERDIYMAGSSRLGSYLILVFPYIAYSEYTRSKNPWS